MLHRNVFVPRGAVLTPVDRAVAAWLWSGRRGVVAGLSAAALHGALWIDAKLPAELNQPSRHKTTGVILHSDHLVEVEVCVLDGIRVTTLAVPRLISVVGAGSPRVSSESTRSCRRVSWNCVTCSRLSIVTVVHVVWSSCAVCSAWPTTAPSRRRRPGCGCC